MDADAMNEVERVKMDEAHYEFNIHFATFWHLTHLACFPWKHVALRPIWKVTNQVGEIWQHQAFGNQKIFSKFDCVMHRKLFFMEKISSTNHADFLDNLLSTVKNYDECLRAVRTLQAKMKPVDVIQICDLLVDKCHGAIELFRQLPIPCAHLFISRIHQLLLLAQNCYPKSFERKFESLFVAHERFAYLIRQDFFSTEQLQLVLPINENKRQNTIATSTSTSTFINLVNAEMFLPTISLNTLIFTLSQNARRVTEQIPAAVTAIIYNYCCIDPFDPLEVDAIKMKVIQFDGIQ